MEVSHIVYVRKKSTSGVGYLTPSHYTTNMSIKYLKISYVVTSLFFSRYKFDAGCTSEVSFENRQYLMQ